MNRDQIFATKFPTKTSKMNKVEMEGEIAALISTSIAHRESEKQRGGIVIQKHEFSSPLKKSSPQRKVVIVKSNAKEKREDSIKPSIAKVRAVLDSKNVSTSRIVTEGITSSDRKSPKLIVKSTFQPNQQKELINATKISAIVLSKKELPEKMDQKLLITSKTIVILPTESEQNKNSKGATTKTNSSHFFSKCNERYV